MTESKKDVQDALQAVGAESTASMREKGIASIFQDQEEIPVCKCCCCTIRKKTAVEKCVRFLFFCCMMTYIAYQLFKYIGPNENRLEYVDLKPIENSPLAYISIMFADCENVLSGESSCDYVFYSSLTEMVDGNDPVATSTAVYEEWTDFQDYASRDIDDVFEYIDNSIGEPIYIETLRLNKNVFAFCACIHIRQCFVFL